jgi:acyl dehydratase
VLAAWLADAFQRCVGACTVGLAAEVAQADDSAQLVVLVENRETADLRFLTPLYPGDSMRVELTVRAKSLKSEDTGVVRWAVEIFNQKDELVATYDLLTENVP